MKHGKAVVAALLGTMLMVTGLSGCGSREVSDTNDGEYQKINLSMAVNGTDTQIDSLVAHHFADLVAERSDGNIVIDVFPNDTLAGGNSTKGVEYIAVGGSDLGAYASCVLANLEPKLSVATLPWSFTSYQQAREGSQDPCSRFGGVYGCIQRAGGQPGRHELERGVYRDPAENH